MVTSTKRVTFQVDEAFRALLPDEQCKALYAFLSVNPLAVIERVDGVLAVNAVPSYLVKQSGHRFNICMLFAKATKPLPVTGPKGFLQMAKDVGKGGMEDLRANLIGSYSKRDGRGVIQLVA